MVHIVLKPGLENFEMRLSFSLTDGDTKAKTWSCLTGEEEGEGTGV